MDQSGIPNECWAKLFSLAQSANDGCDAPPAQLSEQDRNFIEKAMAEVVRTTDPIRQMSEQIARLKLIEKPSEEDVEALTDIVDNLEELICDIDCAADFCKLGGLLEVIRLLKSDCDPVRCEIARLVPSLAQNNPYVQDVILKTDLLPYLLTVVKDANASEELRMKLLGSISSIVRAHEKAFSQFNELKGLETIMDVFQKTIDVHTSVANKAALITTSIARSLGPDAEKYNFLSILLRMALQLPPDSTGCSYAFDYVMDNIIVGGEMDSTDSTDSAGCRKKFTELDPQCKQQFNELLNKQLEYEQRCPEGSPERILRKMKMIADETV